MNSNSFTPQIPLQSTGEKVVWKVFFQSFVPENLQEVSILLTPAFVNPEICYESTATLINLRNSRYIGILAVSFQFAEFQFAEFQL